MRRVREAVVWLAPAWAVWVLAALALVRHVRARAALRARQHEELVAYLREPLPELLAPLRGAFAAATARETRQPVRSGAWPTST